jgi:antitoxin (DNA-binding transcriptional repressor) of toxin-antitoxin stability system
MDPQRSTAPRPAPSLFERLVPPSMEARDLHRRRALAFGVLAAAVLVLGLVYGKDAIGVGFMVALAAFFGARAAYQVWKLRRAPAGEQVAITVDGLPPADRVPALRRALWLGGTAAGALSLWTAWALWTVETGPAENVTVWGPVAAIYRLLGFWPAVLTCPALLVLIVGSGGAKLRRLEEEARAAARRAP